MNPVWDPTCDDLAARAFSPPGDVAAFVELERIATPRLMAYLQTKGVNGEDARDSVIRAWRTLCQAAPNATLDPQAVRQTVVQQFDSLVREKGPTQRLPGEAHTAHRSRDEVPRDIALHARRAFEQCMFAQSLQQLAVMFTDMAGSTAFAEKTSDEEARAKQKTHNDLLFPIIERHHGTVIKTIGDAIMAIFDSVVDAARCAATMMHTLFAYNRANHPNDEDRQIHIRAGIHWGKAIVYREQGRLDVTGSAANVAARVESGGDKRTDQVLLSDQAFAQLLPYQDELPCELVGEVTAKGVGMLRLLRLLWDKDDVRIAAEPLRLAADTAQTFTKRMSEAANTRGIHCLFVDPSTRCGCIRPLFVQVRTSAQPGVFPRVPCDRVMEAAAARAVEAAFVVLRRIGFADADAARHRVEWWIEGPAATYSGASIGLGMALATVAAYTEIGIGAETVVTGAVDGQRVVGVAGITEKCTDVVDKGFARMVVPRTDLAEVPPAHIDLIPVETVQEAVEHVFGSSLGLVKAPNSRAAHPIHVTLAVDPATSERAVSLIPDSQRTWHVGDSLVIRMRADKPCHLALFNIDATGDFSALVPNAFCDSPLTPAGTEVPFPRPCDPFRFMLTGAGGTERLIALAGTQPWNLAVDFKQSGGMVMPSRDDWPRLTRELGGGELAGMAELRLFVEEQPDKGRLIGAGERGILAESVVQVLLRPSDAGFRSIDGI